MTLTQITKIRGPGIHTTSNIVSHNINSSGIITAVAFKGPFTGSSNIQSGIVTATKIDLNGDIDVDGHTNLDNVSVAGVTTFTGDATFSGNVSIGGTLTYEDVTNIDSVGIITARDGLKVLAGGANVVGVVTATSFVGGLPITNGADNRVITASSASAIQGESGLTYDGSSLDVSGIVKAVSDGSAGVVLHRTFSGNVSGATNTPQLDFTLTDTATSNQVVAKISPQALAGTGNAFKGNLRFFTANDAGTSTERLRIASDGKLAIGNASPQQLLHVWPDTANTASAYIRVTSGDRNSNTGIDLGSDASGDGILNVVSNGNLKLYTNNTQRINIANNSAATAIGTNAAFNAMLTVRGDISGQLLHLKATEDTSRLMVSGTDANGCEVNLYDGAGGQKGILGVSTGEFFIKAPNSGAPMGFYTHNGSSIGLRLKINAAGDILLGTDQATIGCNTADGSDNRSFSLCGGSDASQSRGAIITIYGNEANDGHSQYGSLYLRSGNTTTGTIGLWTQGNERLNIAADGHITPGAAGTQDLGSTSKEFRNLYLGDDGSVYCGSDQDIRIFHSSGVNYFTSPTNKQLQLKGDGGLLIRGGGNQNIAQFTQANGVDLYHNQSLKLETSSTGISVTGEVAATQDYPVIKPSLHLNFAATKSLDPRIQYYRHGPASYVDQTGRVVLVGENVPRFDHDPVTRECKGLLVEEAKTNHAIHSTTLLNSAYNYLSSTKVGYSATAPDGTNNATLLYPSSSGAGRGIEDVYTLPSTGKWTTSVYVKSAGLSWVRLYGVNGGVVGYFNVSTGAKGVSVGSVVDYDIIDAGNGWYRIWLTYNLTSTGGNEYFYIYFADADNSTTVTANGTNGIYMWGLQVEKSDFPTSYIPTYDLIQTRGADNAFMDAIDDSFYSQDEGTAIVEYNYTEDSDGAHSLFTFSGRESDPDSSNPRQWLRINKTAGTARGFRYSLTTDAGSSSDDTSAVATPGQWEKFAFAYTAGDQDLYLNGSSVSDLARTPPTNCYRLSFGNVGWGFGTETVMLEGHIRRFIYYPKKLPNSQLATITS